MIMSGLDTYFLEVSVHALLKVATKGSFRGKKYENVAFLGYFSKVKTEECNQIVWHYLVDLALLYLVQLNIFWK